MEWKTWKPWYERIAAELGLDIRSDEIAAKLLDSLLPEPMMEHMRKIVKNAECIVVGAGPSLVEDLLGLQRSGMLDLTIIAADGATSAVLEHRVPDIIVTDLDGNTGDQLDAWKNGSWMVVHAHGDNVRSIRKVVPNLKERVIGTTQVKPFGKLFNFGGFTDGDRAAFLAHELGASRIYLIGMDLGDKIGRYSGKKDPKRKIIKLRICGELLRWLKEKLGANIVDLTHSWT
ncbi:MAG: 6-hydroxymethylpterin diphosphokinase MptE-like protein [Candidatus Hadarchaeales archaeon]